MQAVNNKGVDQTARMRRLICDFVVRMNSRFSHDVAHINDNNVFSRQPMGNIPILKSACIGWDFNNTAWLVSRAHGQCRYFEISLHRVGFQQNCLACFARLIYTSCSFLVTLLY